MTVEVLEPHGFCLGVKQALEKALHALSVSARPVYGLHELVHNERVVADLESRGLRFVESLDAVPEGATVLFSAHGVAPSVREEAVRRHLDTIDATCPFVARVHRQVRAFAAEGRTVLVVGHAAHAETRGVTGEARAAGAAVHVLADAAEADALDLPAAAPLGVVCQTTLSSEDVDAVLVTLRARFTDLAEAPSTDVCRATRERQDAVRAFARNWRSETTGLLVLGSRNSSNTRRLAEIAEAEGLRTWRAGNAAELETALEEIASARLARLGLTAGASTPEDFLACALQRTSHM